MDNASNNRGILMHFSAADKWNTTLCSKCPLQCSVDDMSLTSDPATAAPSQLYSACWGPATTRQNSPDAVQTSVCS